MSNVQSALDPELLTNCARNIEDEYPYFAAELRKKAAAERAATDEIKRLREALAEALKSLEGEPEYHDQGMGCGLEDRGIRDRYDAMHHGWEKAMERVYGENIAWAKDTISAALAKAGEA